MRVFCAWCGAEQIEGEWDYRKRGPIGCESSVISHKMCPDCMVDFLNGDTPYIVHRDRTRNMYILITYSLLGAFTAAVFMRWVFSCF